MYKILLLLPLLTGCQLFMGAGFHDRSLDSEYKEDNVIAHIGLRKEIHENVDAFFVHESMPFFAERDNGRGGGYGKNEIGLELKWDINK